MRKILQSSSIDGEVKFTGRLKRLTTSYTYVRFYYFKEGETNKIS